MSQIVRNCYMSLVYFKKPITNGGNVAKMEKKMVQTWIQTLAYRPYTCLSHRS